MLKKEKVFTINSFLQATSIISVCQNKNIVPIIYIKYLIIDRLGYDWFKEFKCLLEKQFSKKKFKLCIECKKNYGLFIKLVELKADYLMVHANNETLKRLNQIAKKNKVLLNPKFSVVDLSKIKNVELILNKI